MVIRATLREPTPQDVMDVLVQAPLRGWPQDEDDMLGFFKLMLEMLLAESGEVVKT